MKTTIFYASVNMAEYLGINFTGMTYDEVVEFFKNDTVGCATTKEVEFDTSKPNQISFYPSNGENGDFSDTLFVWVKNV